MTDSSGAPEILPELSAAAHRINIKKLEKSPYNHTGKHPGNLFFGHILRLMIKVGTSIIFRNFEKDDVPPNAGGRISVATHINGLVDPSVMIIAQKKRIISLGRHDLITGPVIGWWSRRNGAQPVLRKAEVQAGVANADFARKINDRSMLTIANCLAGGHGAVIMPEGKSHQDSQLHALRTGAARAALVAAAIANERKQPLPVIQPTGLHWERHYWFRTNSYVEYAEPIKINLVFSDEDSLRLAAGEWIEPSSLAVNELKNEMFNRISPLTPDAPDWETYRAWKLIAHLRANRKGEPLKSLRDEVHATRVIREELKENKQLQQAVPDAINAAEILYSSDLDSNSINTHQELKQNNLATSIKAIIGLLLMSIFFLPVLVGSGTQSLLGRYMAEKSDEGLDARTTYFFLAGMFSVVIFWPIISIFIGVLLGGKAIFSLSGIFQILFIMVLFYFSSLMFLLGYDFWSQFRVLSNVVKLSKSSEGEKLNDLVKNLNIQLGLLK